MRAEIIDISSIPRSSVKSAETKHAESSLFGFIKALGLVHTLNRKPTIEARATVESMAMEGVLSADERAAVCQFMGLERGS